jgi:hypothetical protein
MNTAPGFAMSSLPFSGRIRNERGDGARMRTGIIPRFTPKG